MKIPSSEITDEFLYRNRRQFLKTGVYAMAGAFLQQLPAKRGPYDATETPTPYQAITTYNNYYEFGVDKDQPAKTAGKFKTSALTVSVKEWSIGRPRMPWTSCARF